MWGRSRTREKAPGSPQEGGWAGGVWHPESHAAPCFAAGVNENVANELFWEGLCLLPAVEIFWALASGMNLEAV